MSRCPSYVLAVLSACAFGSASSFSAVAAARTPLECAADAENAQSLRERKKLVEAQKRLVACADVRCPAFVRSDCLRWLDEVQATLPSIVVRAAAADGQDALDGTVSVDGGPAAALGVAIPLDPGPHTLAVKSSRGAGELRVLVAEAEKNRVIVVTVGAPSTPPPGASPRPAEPSQSSGGPSPAPWIAGGIGVAGMAAFGAFQLAAQSQYDDLRATCGRACAPDDVDSVRAKVKISAVALGVGIVGLATAAVLFFTQRGKTPASTLTALAPAIRF